MTLFINTALLYYIKNILYVIINGFLYKSLDQGAEMANPQPSRLIIHLQKKMYFCTNRIF